MIYGDAKIKNRVWQGGIIMNNERRMIQTDQGFFYMPSAFVTLKVTVEGIYDHDKMQEAVLRLEKVHPTINNVVCKKGDEMWFEDTGKHVSLVEYDEERNIRWEDAILDMTVQPVNLLEIPGVMVGVVIRSERFYVLMVCHHMYGDGISVKQLMDNLLYMYSTGRILKTRENIPMPTEESLPEDCKMPEALRERLLNFHRTCKEKKVEFSWETYKQMIDTHNATVGTGLTCRNIKGSAFRNLRGKCKEMGVTINSAIATAIAATLQKGDGMDAIVAVDTRAIFDNVGKRGIANYASCVQPRLNYDFNIGFWENVVKTHDKIKQERADNHKVLNTLYSFMILNADMFGVGYHARYGLFRDMEVLMELRNTLGLTKETETFDISNIGKVEFYANSEDFVVRDCYFVSNPMPACACTFGIVTLNNLLTISLGHKQNLVSTQEAKNILEQIITWLSI